MFICEVHLSSACFSVYHSITQLSGSIELLPIAPSIKDTVKMAFFILTAVVAAALVTLVYSFLFIGRRGRNYPHGIYLRYSTRATNNKCQQARQRCLSLAISIKYQRKVHISSMESKPSPPHQESLAYFATARFTELAKTYGGMFSLKLGTGTAVVLTDRRIVKELIDKKSAVSSNRPPSYVSQGIITGGDHLLVMEYGATWRSFRKLIHQEFMESMCEKEHIKIQNAEAIQMLRDFVVAPEHHMLHPKRFSNSVVMSIRMMAKEFPGQT